MLSNVVAHLEPAGTNQDPQRVRFAFGLLFGFAPRESFRVKSLGDGHGDRSLQRVLAT